jgi:predicted CoA-binding protein
VNESTTVRELLEDSEVWAVVGLGLNPSRDAYGVAKFLQQHGKRVIPVHPSAATVHGELGYRTLAEVPVPVDVVDCFVNSSRVGAIVDDAIEISALAVWMQLGVVDLAAAARAEAAGLLVVVDRCPAIDGPRLLGW